jgi:hypothetical protein
MHTIGSESVRSFEVAVYEELRTPRGRISHVQAESNQFGSREVFLSQLHNVDTTQDRLAHDVVENLVAGALAILQAHAICDKHHHRRRQHCLNS